MTLPDDDRLASDGRRLRRSVWINVGGTLGKALWPLFIAIAARRHGATVLGTFLVIQAAVDITQSLVSSGYVAAIHRFTARRPGDPLPAGFHALLRSCLVSVIAIEVAVGAIGWSVAFAVGISDDALITLAVMTGSLVLQSVAAMLVAPFTAMLRNEIEVVLLQFLAPALVNVLALLLPPTLAGLGLSFMFAYAIAAIVALGALHRSVGLRGLVTDRTPPPAHRRYAILQGLNAGLWISVYSLDTLLLGAFVSPALVVLYRAGSEITRALYLVRVQFVGAFAPLAARYLADGETRPLARILADLSTTMTWIGAAVVGAIALWREPLLHTALGAPPREAGFVVVLLAGQLYLCMTALTGSVLAMGGWAALLLKNGIAMTVANVVLNVILDPWLGLVGAAISTLCAMAVSQTLQLFELPRVVGIRHRLAGPLRAFAVAAVAFAVAWPCGLALADTPARIVRTAVFAALLAAGYAVSRRAVTRSA